MLDKLAAWLKEDILLRRVKVPKTKKKTAEKGTEPPLQASEQAALREAEALAITLAVPVSEAA